MRYLLPWGLFLSTTACSLIPVASSTSHDGASRREVAGGETVRVLVTAFEPFAGRSENASRTLVREFKEIFRADLFHRPVEFKIGILPVVYSQAGGALNRLIDDFEPHLVVATGEAKGSSYFVETQAVNLDKSKKPDNAGVVRDGVSISPNGKTLLFSSLPVMEIRRRLEVAGFDARTSRNAGGFLCNHVFYHLMERVQNGDGPLMAGFVHIPREAPRKRANALRGLPLRIIIEASLEALVQA